MKYVLTILLLASGPAHAYEAALYFPREIRSAYDTTCALSGDSVTCLKQHEEQNGRFTVNRWTNHFHNPRSLSVGYRLACVIDGEESKCFDGGYSRSYKLVAHPQRLSVGGDGFCVAGDEGIFCQAFFREKNKFFPDFKNVSALEMYLNGEFDFNVIADGVARRNSGAAIEAQRPTELSLKYKNRLECLLDAEGVKCLRGTEVPVMNDPQGLAVGDGYACAIDQGEMKCWGENRLLDQPIFTQPRAIGAGVNHACAIDAEAVKCWGNFSQKEPDIWSMHSTIFLDRLGDHFGLFARSVPPAWAAYFREMQIGLNKDLGGAELRDDLSQSRYLALLLAWPAFEALDSTYFRENTLLGLGQAENAFNNRFGFLDRESALSGIPDSVYARRASLVAFGSAFRVALQFLPLPERKQLEGLETTLAAAERDPSNQLISALLKTAQEASFTALRPSPKSAFLVTIMERAMLRWQLMENRL